MGGKSTLWYNSGGKTPLWGGEPLRKKRLLFNQRDESQKKRGWWRIGQSSWDGCVDGVSSRTECLCYVDHVK